MEKPLDLNVYDVSGAADELPGIGRFQEFVKAIGTGPGRGRVLLREEACEAFTMILQGGVAPSAIGAFFAILRYRGESASEIAGFVDACSVFYCINRDKTAAGMVDWPSYASGSLGSTPYQIFAAALAARAGLRVLLHAHAEYEERMNALLSASEAAGISVAADLASAGERLQTSGVTMIFMSSWARELLELFNLRSEIGLRTPLHSLVKALNPLSAEAGVIGVFHPAYAQLHVDSAALLGQPAVAVWKGGGGEAIRNPYKSTMIGGRVDETNAITDVTFPALLADTRGRKLQPMGASDLAALWRGAGHELGKEAEAEATATIVGSAAVALWVSGVAKRVADADQLAKHLWERRNTG